MFLRTRLAASNQKPQPQSTALLGHTGLNQLQVLQEGSSGSNVAQLNSPTLIMIARIMWLCSEQFLVYNFQLVLACLSKIMQN